MRVLICHRGSQAAADEAVAKLNKQFPGKQFVAKPTGAGRADVELEAEPPVTQIDIDRYKQVAVD